MGSTPAVNSVLYPACCGSFRRLAEHHNLHVYALFQDGAPPRYSLCGATIHHVGRGRTALRAIGALWREHRRGPFALLHAVWASPSGALACVAAQMLRAPVLVHLAGGELTSMPDIDYGELRNASGRRRVESALDGARRITAHSQPVVDAATAMGYSVTRLPLGVALDAWPLQAPRARTLDRPARLMYIASLHRVKDPAMLVRTAALLDASRIDFTLDVVGEDTLGGSIQQQAAEAGLGHRINFHGFLEQKRLRPLLQQADLLLVSSRHEAGPIVLAEAATCGVPTVGTNVGMIAEWAPEAALAVPPGDAEALAGAARSLLEDDARRLRTAELAQRLAVAEDADWSAARIAGLYEELTAA